MDGSIYVEPLPLSVCSRICPVLSESPGAPASSGTAGINGKAVFEFALLMASVCIPRLGDLQIRGD